jgi:hypothetical protein
MAKPRQSRATKPRLGDWSEYEATRKRQFELARERMAEVAAREGKSVPPRRKSGPTKGRLGDWRDYEATQNCLAEGRLTEMELALLHDGHYVFSPDNQGLMTLEREIARALKKPVGAAAVSEYVRQVAEPSWWDWLDRVLSYEVELKAVARAVVRGPGDGYRVEMQWVFHRKDKAHYVKSVQVVADDFLNVRQSFPVGEHVAAFMLRVNQQPRGAFARAPQSRPAPGQPLDTAFYARLLASHDRLMTEYRYPAAELARRMDENPSTVRTWLKRARELKKRGES